MAAKKANSEAEAITTQEPEETGLATVPTETALACPEDLQGYTGMEGIDDGAFIIPRMKIVQPTSKKGTPGNFIMNLTGEEFSQLFIVGIKAEQGRTKWVEGEDKPACRSLNGHVPDPRIEEPSSEVCGIKKKLKSGKIYFKETCPDTIWGSDGTPPACGKNFNFLCLDMNLELPFWLAVSGKSIDPLRRYITVINIRRKRLWEFSSIMSLEEVTGGKGRYFVLNFAPPTPLNAEDQEHIIEIVRGLKHETVQRTFDAEDEAEAEDAADAADAPNWMGGEGADTAQA